MKLTVLALLLLSLGCSYSPEEQYRECIREVLPLIRDSADVDQAYHFVRYDAICRLSAGMNQRVGPLAMSIIVGESREVAELLEQFED